MERKEKFYEQFNQFLKNLKLVSLNSYEKIVRIKEFLQNPPDKRSKTGEEYNWINRLYLKDVAGSIEVYYKSDNRQMVALEEVFDLIDTAHAKTKHGGRDILKYACKNFSGIPQEAFQMYLNLCEQCELKKARVKKGLVVKPILSEEMNSRCQLDLIDMQAQEYQGLKYIMVYQDHLTKFAVLKALPTKSAPDVAKKLIEVFGIFGAPRILHTDNGREFANQLIKCILENWPGCKLVHGKPRHPQSQGSVERANKDIEDMLTIHCSENKTNNWVDALPIIQAAKNRRFHSGIKRSPYEGMFGKPMKIGISDDHIPPEIMENLEIEEDLAQIFNFNANESNNTEVALEEPTREGRSENPIRESFDFYSLRDENMNLEPSTSKANSPAFSEHDEIVDYGLIADKIEHERREAKRNLEVQAKKMLKTSDKRLQPVEAGTSVLIPVPKVDRSKVDHRNVMGTILEEEEGFYRLGTKQGILPQLYTRNQFSPASADFLQKEEVPPTATTLRSTAIASSSVGGQGFLYCNCTQKCDSNRCKCVRSGFKCTSKCHNSLACKNK